MASARAVPSTGVRAGPAPARRLAAPSWRDPKLLVGVVLVLGSVVLGARTSAAAGRTTGVYEVAATVPVGAGVTAGDVRVVQVRLDERTAAAYLTADTPLPGGLVAVRALPAGELLPRSGLGSAADLDGRPVTLPLPGGVPDGVVTGGRADVWVTWPVDPGDVGQSPVPGDPQRLVEAADVTSVRSGGTGLAARTGAELSGLVPGDVLPQVLRALAADATIAVVPVPGSAPGDGGHG